MANAAVGDSLVNHVQLYRYLVTGESYDFSVATLGNESQVGELRYPKDNNNVLHIAASFGHVELVTSILEQWPELFRKGNSKGDLAIHSAIKACKNNTVGVLLHDWRNRGETIKQALQWKNADGNTALHIALENDDEQLAKFLVEVHPPALYIMNNAEICPLYLAIKLEMRDLLAHMLPKFQVVFREDTNRYLREGKSVVQALIYAKRIELLQDTLHYNPQLIYTADKEGKTALSYAAYVGDLEKARLLFKANQDSAFICDKDGAYPIHQAVSAGHTDIIKLLASSMFLLNAKDQNIIHVATLIDNPNLVSLLLGIMPKIDSLINQKDGDGNTPLHLATLSKHDEVIKVLLQDVRVMVGVLNKEGLTAYDLAKKLMLENQSISVVQRLNAIFERAKSGFYCGTIDGKNLQQLLYQGNINQFREVLLERRIRIKDLECLEDGNNILHIAARLDNNSLNKVINILRCRYDEFNQSNVFEVFMEQANNLGNLPVHVATHVGKLESLKALFLMSNIPNDGICLRPNMKGNTPLHIAVLDHQMDIASYLYDKCPKAAYSLNKDNICPFFLAINYWSESNLVTRMINGLDEHIIRNYLMGAKSVIHAAILTRSAILESMVEKAPQLLLNSLDSNGRNPLSYAAHIGHVKGVKYLQDRYPELEFKRDKDEDGSFPIHQAAKGGQLQILKLLHPEKCLLNSKGQNILHIAAGSGRFFVVNYLLKRKEFRDLLNTQDEDGNTPLHLAIKGLHYYVVDRLTLEKYCNGSALNNELLTARDMFEQQLQDQIVLSSSQKEVVYLMLGLVEGEHSFLSKNRGAQRKENTIKEMEEVNDAKDDKVDVPSNMKAELTESDRANVLLVVAAFVITVTFAAKFTPPGGYDQQTGLPVLREEPVFKYFTSFNNIAFFCAVCSATCFIWGAIMPKLSRGTLLLGGLYLYIGFLSMVFAFINGSLDDDASKNNIHTFVITIVLTVIFVLCYLLMMIFKNSTRIMTKMYITMSLRTFPHRKVTPIDFTI